MTGEDWAWVAAGICIAAFRLVVVLVGRIIERPRLKLLPLHVFISIAETIRGLILLPIGLCLALIPFYLLGVFLLWMGIWNNPASGSACEIYGWIPHLADCPDRTATMILTGQILLDGQPIPREQEGSATGNIAFLSGFVGTERVALDEFFSNPRYSIGIEGTAAMKGAEITFQLQLPPSCYPTECVAAETIPFKAGKTREVDLHFESNR